ncbi:Eukaryotic translation initiation factor 3 subunit D [Abeliophyllum distichum]|uniref:Eukaryotic translation initiation factor 3 subunit D n=1 Tax=Abeliophyllum distichum TaxID=126358 RepID=A0ABD1V7H0_9LAMI
MSPPQCTKPATSHNPTSQTTQQNKKELSNHPPYPITVVGNLSQPAVQSCLSDQSNTKYWGKNRFAFFHYPKISSPKFHPSDSAFDFSDNNSFVTLAADSSFCRLVDTYAKYNHHQNANYPKFNPRWRFNPHHQRSQLPQQFRYGFRFRLDQRR